MKVSFVYKLELEIAFYFATYLLYEKKKSAVDYNIDINVCVCTVWMWNDLWNIPDEF